MTASVSINGRAKGDLAVATPITGWWGGWGAATIQAWYKPDASLTNPADPNELNRGVFIEGTPGDNGVNMGIALYWRKTAADTSVIRPLFSNFTCALTAAGRGFAVSDGNRQKTGVAQLGHSTWVSGQIPKLYLDKVLLPQTNSATGTGTIMRAAGTVYIGESTGNANFPRLGTWKGQIDEVRLRAQALSAEHIALEYDSWTFPQGVYAIGAEDQALDTNQGPLALPDFDVPATQNNPVTIDVIANDIDPEGGTKTLVSVTAVTGCSAIKDPNDPSKVRFVPTGGFLGRAVFSYEMQDAGGKQATGWCSVNVTTPVVGPELPRTAPVVTITTEAQLTTYITTPSTTNVATMS